MKYSITPYVSSMSEEWNEALQHMRQQSFLLNRGYMDYHKDRFADASLIIRDQKGHVVALMPANKDPKGTAQVQSHGGLTYGGLLTSAHLGTKEIGEILEACARHYAFRGFDEMLYKPMPHIYHVQPAEEDLYWMHRMGARLIHRSVSSAIQLNDALPFSTLRKRKVKKSEKLVGAKLMVNRGNLANFWQLLDHVLFTRHHTHPVHSSLELLRLWMTFPEQIRVITLEVPDGNEYGYAYEDLYTKILAGCTLFLTKNVAHVQYIAASDEGRENGALDSLFQQVIGLVKAKYPDITYFDFGISTEDHGQVLNNGLIFQKEGFGARAICYDEYLLPLTPYKK